MSLDSVRNWRDRLDAGDLTAEALVQDSLTRIQALDGSLHAVLSVDEPRALELARRADRRLKAGERTPVLGLPVALKDNLAWREAPATCGSRMLEGYRSPYDATVVARLLAAGAIPIAKVNLDEFAMGSSGEHSAFGPTRNPWDTSRVPGGSSSGAIVAVSAGYVPLALGSDTGGSVRLPASFCSVTALRPSYGVLSRHGLTALASSLDQVGPVGATVVEVAAALQVMAGQDPHDSTSADLPRKEALFPLQPADLAGLRIGIPAEYWSPALDPGVRTCLDEALREFRALGAQLVEVELPHTRFAIDTYYLICTSEASSNLGRFDGIRYGHRSGAPDGTASEQIARTRDEGFGPEVKRRILLGTFCLSRGWYDAFYLKALKARALIARDFQEAFRRVDLLAAPVSPVPAFQLGARTTDPLSMYLADVLTVPSALAALPALALPAGFTDGLPVGLQLIGPSFSDTFLLEAGHAFQLATRHHLQTPPLSMPGVPHGL